MKAEYRKEAGCPQMDSAEHEEYVGAQSAGGQEVKVQDGADLLERILSREKSEQGLQAGESQQGSAGNRRYDR